MEFKDIKLSEITEVITKGTTPTTIGFSFQNTGINFVKIESINEDSTFNNYKLEHISEECNEKLKRSQLKENDILFSIAGAIGKAAIVTQDILPANTNQALAIIRLKDDTVSVPYLYRYLKSNYVIQQFEKKKQGVAQLNLSLKDIGELVIKVPDKGFQSKIVRILDEAQTLINNRKQQIVALDQLTQSVFLEMFGDIAFNSKRWNIKPIGDVIKSIISGWSVGGEEREKQKDEIAVLKISAITSGTFNPNEYKVISRDVEIKKAIHPIKGDLLFSRANTRELVGASAIVRKDYFDLIIPDKLWKIEINDNEVTTEYFKTIISNGVIRSRFSKNATGTSGSMLNISMEKFKNINIPVPPLDLQYRFSHLVERIYTQKCILEASLVELENNFKSLIQRAFKGELFTYEKVSNL